MVHKDFNMESTKYCHNKDVYSTVVNKHCTVVKMRHYWFDTAHDTYSLY